MNLGITLTEDEYQEVRNSILILEQAGNPEVNGEYHFTSIKSNAGYYVKKGQYNGQEARFTLYKCSLRNGGFQWFISITPEGMEPGTSSDLDFYFATAKPQEILPVSPWATISGHHVRAPAPRMRRILQDLVIDDPVTSLEDDEDDGAVGGAESVSLDDGDLEDIADDVAVDGDRDDMIAEIDDLDDGFEALVDEDDVPGGGHYNH